MQISRKHELVPADPVHEGAHLGHLVQGRGLAGAELVGEAAVEVTAAAVVATTGPGGATIAEAAVALSGALKAVGVEARQHVHVGGVEQADEARVPALPSGGGGPRPAVRRSTHSGRPSTELPMLKRRARPGGPAAAASLSAEPSSSSW